MKEIETINFKENKLKLENVLFVPNKFGLYTISNMIFGFGCGELFFNIYIGIICVLIGLYGLIKSYNTRTKL